MAEIQYYLFPVTHAKKRIIKTTTFFSAICSTGQADAECVHRTAQSYGTARMDGSAPLRFTRSSTSVSDPMDMGIQ